MNQQLVVEYITENVELGELLTRARSAISLYFFNTASVVPSNLERERGSMHIVCYCSTHNINRKRTAGRLREKEDIRGSEVVVLQG